MDAYIRAISLPLVKFLERVTTQLDEFFLCFNNARQFAFDVANLPPWHGWRLLQACRPKRPHDVVRAPCFFHGFTVSTFFHDGMRVVAFYGQEYAW